MRKFKNILIEILSFLGLLLLFFKFANNKTSISKETQEKSVALDDQAKTFFDQAETIDKEAKKLDNVVIQEDEEWYKKH